MNGVLKALAKGLSALVPDAFTGKVVVTINFHSGTAATALVNFEHGMKL